MITREFLQKNGFEKDNGVPSSVEDFYRRENPQGGYISIRFVGEKATGLHAYLENEHVNIRKVVISDSTITMEDYENAIKICKLEK